MPYSLLAADGTRIATGYFTDTEDDGREFIGWADTPASAHKLIERLRQADRLDNAYGVVLWKTEDVADKYGVSQQEAAEYLDTINGRLQDAQTEKAWEIIDFWRDEMPDARTAEQKAAWEQAQEEADEQQRTGRYW